MIYPEHNSWIFLSKLIFVNLYWNILNLHVLSDWKDKDKSTTGSVSGFSFIILKSVFFNVI